jgi:ribosomal protein L37AE/L43A
MVTCPSCFSKKWTRISDGYHYNTKGKKPGKKLRKQRYYLYNCSNCNKNFEITEEWEDADTK